jgi:hypothetical protein
MNSLQSTCCLNNQAVKVLMSSQPSKISKTFQNALQLLAREMLTGSGNIEHPNKNVGYSRLIGVPDLQVSTCFIYNHAFITYKMICYDSSALTLHREEMLGTQNMIPQESGL